VQLQHCGHEGVHACLLSWFFGKAQTQFADFQTVFTHRVLFVMFNKIENPAHEMRSVICFLKLLSCMENKPWVVQSYGDGCDCLMKDAKMCMIICGAADCLWWMKIWCLQLKTRLEKTENWPSHHSLYFPQISLSLLHEIVSDKLKFRKLCAHCAEDAYLKTRIETASQYIGLSDTMQWGRPKFLKPCSRKGWDMGVAQSP